MNVFAKQVAHILKAHVPCKRIGVMVAGLEVPHAHIHLIPMNAISDLSFANERPAIEPQQMEMLANAMLSDFAKRAKK
jgi:histidine triad (HIT) family protein